MKLTQTHGRIFALQHCGFCGLFLSAQIGGIEMESIKQTIERLEKERDALAERVYRLKDEQSEASRTIDIEIRRRKRAEQLQEHYLEMLNECNSRKFARFNNEECWIYQSDGENNFNSLVCPVVISTENLKNFVTHQIKAFIQHCFDKQDPDDCIWCLEDVEAELNIYENQLREYDE